MAILATTPTATARGPSLLSSRILSVFVTAFGAFGAIGIHSATAWA